MVIHWRRHFNWFLRSLWYASQRWNRCDCVDLSAAFAYYTLQSFFPILLISLSVASWFLGNQQGLDQQIIGLASQVLPPSVVGLVETTLIKLVNQGFGAGILGAMFLIITAGNAYLTLQRGADRLWEDALPSKTSPIPLRMQAFRLIRNRIEAFLVVLLVGVLMVIDEISSYLRMIPGAVWTDLKDNSPQLTNTLSKIPLIEVGQVIIPFMGFTIMALLLQALVPRRRVPIRPLIPGSIMIGTLLTLLNSAVSRTILSLGSRFQAYGIISGVLVLTLWIWLVGLIIYFGQCWSIGLVSNQVNRHRKTKTIHISI
ncbi:MULTISPECIES: YihY/virulence factor BrkB family protein [Prochlorococcus]|uniref:Ribonuclease BN family protein n=1 Tax=Prochlorococcus marinus (strain SARG / CCMP1375 / SS120) TaxID=167539 RepID=Q7VE99_PROMA|nr:MULTISPECIES: YihY/virulence factor BrkB family protein [Prochlorococcus]AAP99160.1 Ribonuclease BN family protein [Prochlorococcus marinus subsp. marinus str. CCMP1375]KGG11570.1 Ribonuclease BN family protein [Prochlorococcus marinus str. LG]KGG18476.1 Ribonuclease BN family protein [Prochlorococcus marinus str. SS2]KGG22749.1 Ribonuclease BN family protein [Prochlorococcus marinus str. SS35]KGG32625.1 Ribonuclease BN family protein [Prochlorococcus marinus str. SS51]